MIITQKEEMINIARTVAAAANVPETLLLRVAEVESAWNPWAVRYEPAFGRLWLPPALRITTTQRTEQELQRMSWGLCQIMGYTARRLGWIGPIPAICDPVTNLDLAATYLRELAEQSSSPQRWRWAITAYNHSERWEEIDQSWFREGYTAKFDDILREVDNQ